MLRIMPRILLVEDEPDLARNLADFLGEAHEVDVVGDGETGLRVALEERHDLAILDLGLPRLDGLTLCREVRAVLGQKLAVLMLTARDTLEDKIAGFEAGADDYLVKPFALQELEARVGALLRRGSVSGPAVDAKVLRVSDLEFDVGRCAIRRGDRPVTLHRMGMRILAVLMRASPNVVRREDLEQQVWGRHRVSESVVRTHLWQLRRAIFDTESVEPLVHTVHGIGYRIGRPEAPAGARA
jgi:DNA-binding response OmpR family regulator